MIDYEMAYKALKEEIKLLCVDCDDCYYKQFVNDSAEDIPCYKCTGSSEWKFNTRRFKDIEKECIK